MLLNLSPESCDSLSKEKFGFYVSAARLVRFYYFDGEKLEELNMSDLDKSAEFISVTLRS